MRTCAKMRCGYEPVVTVSLSYGERQVVIEDLRPERDPNLLDPCREHTERMTPPAGWTIRDRRAPPPAPRGRPAASSSGAPCGPGRRADAGVPRPVSGPRTGRSQR